MDRDGIPDLIDNCPRHRNALQMDSDGDGNGDACDCDSSGSISLCYNDAFCETLEQDYTCHCTIGYTGELCDAEIDECMSNPCRAGSTCLDRLAMYECICDSASMWGYRCNLSNPNVIHVPNTIRAGSVLGSVQPIDAEEFEVKQFIYSGTSLEAGGSLPFQVTSSTGEIVLDKPVVLSVGKSFQASVTITTVGVQSPLVPSSTVANIVLMVRDRDDPVLDGKTFNEYTGKL